MHRFLTLAMLGALALVPGGCAEEGDPASADQPKAATAAAMPPAGPAAVSGAFGEAMKQCEELSDTIAGLIERDALSQIHPPAEAIKKIAETIPAIAYDELTPEGFEAVRAKARALAGTFSEIDEVADAGKKEETIKAHEKIRLLIADLKAHGASHRK